MISPTLRKHLRGAAYSLAIATLIVACAAPVRHGMEPVYESTPVPAPSGVPAGEPVPAGDDGVASGTVPTAEYPARAQPPRQLEEITVSRNRVGKTDDRETSADGPPVSAGSLRAVSRAYEQERRETVKRYASPGGGSALAGVNAGEEVWIIAKPPGDAAQVDEERPGSGSMLTLVSEGPDLPAVRVPLPLKHTAVTASIDGYLGSVNVRQRFENPFLTKIEAVYVFPLPEMAAVNEFVMIIGERRIRGILREREEAKAIYAEARRQGYQASLLLQERPNIFQQKVANIEPGKSIDVDIRYFHSLAYRDGWYSFVFPTVVGPRFNPPGSKDPIEALPRGAISNGGTAVTYLHPSERSGHDISIDVRVDAGVPIEDLRSSHAISATKRSDSVAEVSLANRSTIPNRDFVLDFKVAGDTVRSNLLTWKDPESGQGYFSMMLYPPASLGNLPRRPMEMVFVVDCSGSMSGKPIGQAKAAILAALDELEPQDTFQVIRFSSNASQLGDAPLPATRENIARARDYVRKLGGGGGTMMIEGIRAALDFPHDPERLRFVSFMTDGYIGNETEILGAIHERVGESRIFSFGVGNSVNRYLMERMAKQGRGAVAYLGLDDSGKDIMQAFFARISKPALSDLQIDWGNMQVTSVYPSKIPDLFVGRPVFVTGKFSGTPSSIAVTGLAGNETQQFVVSAGDTAAGGPDSGSGNLAKLWARLRIADYSDRKTWQQDPSDQLGAAIQATALEYQLMSDYTAFVAVDASRRTEGDHGVTVQQPVPVPDGVRYETTVQE